MYSGAERSLTGTTSQTVNQGADGTAVTAVANPGHHFVSWSDGVTTATRTDRNVTAALSVTASFAINSYTLTGFYQAVDMSAGSTIVLNTVKGGASVPLKFNVYVNGVEQTSTNELVFSYGLVGCGDGSALEAPLEITATGATSLRWDETAHQFMQNWKTPSRAGRCYVDASVLSAYFKTK